MAVKKKTSKKAPSIGTWDRYYEKLAAIVRLNYEIDKATEKRERLKKEAEALKAKLK